MIQVLNVPENSLNRPHQLKNKIYLTIFNVTYRTVFPKECTVKK